MTPIQSPGVATADGPEPAGVDERLDARPAHPWKPATSTHLDPGRRCPRPEPRRRHPQSGRGLVNRYPLRDARLDPQRCASSHLRASSAIPMTWNGASRLARLGRDLRVCQPSMTKVAPTHVNNPATSSRNIIGPHATSMAPPLSQYDLERPVPTYAGGRGTAGELQIPIRHVLRDPGQWQESGCGAPVVQGWIASLPQPALPADSAAREPDDPDVRNIMVDSTGPPRDSIECHRGASPTDELIPRRQQVVRWTPITIVG